MSLGITRFDIISSQEYLSKGEPEKKEILAAFDNARVVQPGADDESATLAEIKVVSAGVDPSTSRGKALEILQKLARHARSMSWAEITETQEYRRATPDEKKSYHAVYHQAYRLDRDDARVSAKEIDQLRKQTSNPTSDFTQKVYSIGFMLENGDGPDMGPRPPAPTRVEWTTTPQDISVIEQARAVVGWHVDEERSSASETHPSVTGSLILAGQRPVDAYDATSRLTKDHAVFENNPIAHALLLQGLPAETANEMAIAASQRLSRPEEPIVAALIQARGMTVEQAVQAASKTKIQCSSSANVAAAAILAGYDTERAQAYVNAFERTFDQRSGRYDDDGARLMVAAILSQKCGDTPEHAVDAANKALDERKNMYHPGFVTLAAALIAAGREPREAGQSAARSGEVGAHDTTQNALRIEAAAWIAGMPKPAVVAGAIIRTRGLAHEYGRMRSDVSQAAFGVILSQMPDRKRAQALWLAMFVL